MSEGGGMMDGGQSSAEPSRDVLSRYEMETILAIRERDEQKKRERVGGNSSSSRYPASVSSSSRPNSSRSLASNTTTSRSSDNNGRKNTTTGQQQRLTDHNIDTAFEGLEKAEQLAAAAASSSSSPRGAAASAAGDDDEWVVLIQQQERALRLYESALEVLVRAVQEPITTTTTTGSSYDRKVLSERASVALGDAEELKRRIALQKRQQQKQQQQQQREQVPTTKRRSKYDKHGGGGGGDSSSPSSTALVKSGSGRFVLSSLLTSPFSKGGGITPTRSKSTREVTTTTNTSSVPNSNSFPPPVTTMTTSTTGITRTRSSGGAGGGDRRTTRNTNHAPTPPPPSMRTRPKPRSTPTAHQPAPRRSQQHHPQHDDGGGDDQSTTSSNNNNPVDKLREKDNESLINVIKNDMWVNNPENGDEGVVGVRWSDVAGLEQAKQSLQEAVILPLLRPDLYTGLRSAPKGILLYGPPGTGKTLLAKAAAFESQCNFFACSASSLTSKWVGEGEKLVKALFRVASDVSPSIIFLDELDALLSTRKDDEHESSRRFKTEFMVQVDGVVTKSSGSGRSGHVLLLGATNCPWDLDDAVLRRFSRRIYIPLPDAAARKSIVRSMLKKNKHSLSKSDVKGLIQQTEGYSASDLTSIGADAAFGPLRSLGGIDQIRKVRTSDVRPINVDDFHAALRNNGRSVSRSLLKRYDEWEQRQNGEQ